MKNLLLVGAGGFAGAIGRYLVGGWVQGLARGSSFPYGTFAVNMLGCLVIGLLGGLAEHRSALSPEMRLLLMVGLLGGFTTFSSFSYESLGLVRDGQTVAALLNMSLQVIIGFGAVLVGYKASVAL